MALDFDMLVSGILTLFVVAMVIGYGANLQAQDISAKCKAHSECVEVYYD